MTDCLVRYWINKQPRLLLFIYANILLRFISMRETMGLNAWMDKDILWATTIVDQKAELDQQEQKHRTRAQKLGILIVDESKAQRQMSDETLNQSTANIPCPVDCENFLKAAINGNVKVIDKFLEVGGDPNTADEFRKSALHMAAFEGHVKIVERLLDKGANIDFRDRLACTAVHWACRGGRVAALKLLQCRGADLNIRDKLLSTPLHVATRTGHWEVVEHLISSGVQINAKDWEGDTALHDAVRLNRYKIAKLLILAGADMTIKNTEGVTAREQVKMWQCDTKEMLEQLDQMK
ncbi:ankyrin repeat domain-containing protein 2 isoform X1 [Tachysurus fulvidraco]|uniref:ankyrin repeat domain-containing protein 2 isoform X1 n=2 Tax=Tachysurus fulvidraco TaxID=1234273 RepID=UPI000F4F407F|nr:ankyrin repeat domain-containing protein 2 isoform X1 [Tachysurus fulvidraco]